MIYDALDMEYREMKIRRDPNAAEITELIDYEAFCGIVSDEAQTAAVGNTITAPELKQKMDAGDKFELIDVREPHEWEIVKIPGAKLIPKDKILSGEALRRDPPGPPDDPALQVGRPLRRGALGAAQGRLLQRRPRRRRRHRLGPAGRHHAADLLSHAAPGGAAVSAPPSRCLPTSGALRWSP